jgi:hypothetical protein
MDFRSFNTTTISILILSLKFGYNTFGMPFVKISHIDIMIRI